jgi:hypothetical protein
MKEKERLNEWERGRRRAREGVTCRIENATLQRSMNLWDDEVLLASSHYSHSNPSYLCDHLIWPCIAFLHDRVRLRIFYRRSSSSRSSQHHSTPLHYDCLQFFTHTFIVWPHILHSQRWTPRFLTVWLEPNHGIWRDAEGARSLPLFDIHISYALFSLQCFSTLIFVLYCFALSHSVVFYSTDLVVFCVFV